MPLKQKRAARGTRGPRAPSIFDGFCRRPWLASVVGSVAPDVCLLAHEAARASPEAIREDGQNGSKPATTPGEPRGEEIAGPWPRCGVPALRPMTHRQIHPFYKRRVQP